MRTSLVLVLALTTLGSTACSGALGEDDTGAQSSALRGDPIPHPIPQPPTPDVVLAGGGIEVLPPKGPPQIPPPASLYGTIEGYAGSPGTYGHSDGPIQTSFGHPTLIASASNGLTWVVDRDDTVDEYGRHPQSQLRLIADTGRGKASYAHVGTYPWQNVIVEDIRGMVADPSNGDLYVTMSSTYLQTIVKITAGGTVTNIAGFVPQGLNGQLLPAAYFNDSPLDASGVAHPFDARFDGPSGIARDPQGNLFVADTNNHAVRKITPAGAVSTVAQDANVSPTALAFDRHDGSLFTISGHAVYRVVPGQMSVWAGNPTTAGYQDSIAQLSYFDGPEGLAIDRSGNVYVADTGNARIRKIVPSDGSLFSMVTVTTISFQPYNTQYAFDGYGPAEAKLEAPTGLSFWGDALVMSDRTRGTVRILH